MKLFKSKETHYQSDGPWHVTPNPEQIGHELIDGIAVGWISDDVEREVHALEQETRKTLSELGTTTQIDTLMPDHNTLIIREALRAGITIETNLLGFPIEVVPITSEGPDPSGDREPRHPVQPVGTLSEGLTV